jgi:hypothetical protein
VTFRSTFRYIDGALSINNDQFHSYVDSIYRYPSELEIKDTTESCTSSSYLHVLLNIDAGGKISSQLYDKRDDFSFTIVNFLYIYIYIYVSTSHYHLHMGYTSINWFDMQGSARHSIRF